MKLNLKKTINVASSAKREWPGGISFILASGDGFEVACADFSTSKGSGQFSHYPTTRCQSLVQGSLKLTFPDKEFQISQGHDFHIIEPHAQPDYDTLGTEVWALNTFFDSSRFEVSHLMLNNESETWNFRIEVSTFAVVLVTQVGIPEYEVIYERSASSERASRELDLEAIREVGSVDSMQISVVNEI